MAKKQRQKIEEEKATAFEFPVFDETAFIKHELDLSWATVIALTMAILLGVLGAAVVHVGLPYTVPIVIGILGIASIPSTIQTVRHSREVYTKGDWAGILAVAIFVWIGVWFLLSGLL
jgi:hypothetical protein